MEILNTENKTPEVLKCLHCHRIAKNGISDFYSLVNNNSTEIKKTCKKCRLETYKSYKNKHPDKFKKNNILYSKNNVEAEEVKEYKRCPKCRRTTTGIVDYKHYKNDAKICKNCAKCRLSVLECYKRKKQNTPKKMTKSQEIIELKELIRKIDEDIITSSTEN